MVSEGRRTIAAVALIIVDFLWGVLMIAGCAYLVFAEGHSPWWFVLAVALSQWSAPKGVVYILTGVPEKKED